MAMLKRKRSGLNDPMSVVTKFVNACNRHDADGIASCLHPDFDSIQPMYPSRNFRGADQVRRNWQAIFDAEPGFRLTVLRSAVADDTIWLELHGAGEAAEVAGVFVMGVQGDRIRWARIYSALVEPVPEGTGQPAGTVREAPRHDQPAGAGTAGDGEVVEESLIAPVLDMDRSGRRRRRRWGSHAEEPAAVAATPETGEAAAAAGAGADAAAVAMADADTDTDAGAEVDVVVEGGAEADVQVVVVAGPDPGGEGATHDGGEPTGGDDGGPPTEAVDMITVAGEDGSTEAPAPDPDDPNASA